MNKKYTIYEVTRSNGKRTGFITFAKNKDEVQDIIESSNLNDNYYNVTGPRGTDTIHDLQMLNEYVMIEH